MVLCRRLQGQGILAIARILEGFVWEDVAPA